MGKRCDKGKSCGATCIDRDEICRKDLPPSVSDGLTKVSELKSQSKPQLKLSLLTTEESFKEKIKTSEGLYDQNLKNLHSYTGKLLGKVSKETDGYTSALEDYKGFKDDEERKKFSKIRSDLIRELGDGDKVRGEKLLKAAIMSIYRFTGLDYPEMRQAQMGADLNPKYLKRAKIVERLINDPRVEKPMVEKFRGKRVTIDTLKGMIRSANAGREFDGKALSSWSTQLSSAKDFADRHQDGRSQRVILRAINTKGMSVMQISGSSHEHEILTSGTARYRYLKHNPIVVDGVTFHVFDVEEF